MNGWKNWILGIVGAVAAMALGGAIILSLSLSSSVAVAQEAIVHNASSIVANEADIIINEVEIDENGRKVDKIETEWEWFKHQYREDRKMNQEAHRAILEKLEEIDR